MEAQGGTIDTADKTVVCGGFGVFNTVGVGFFAGRIVDVATEIDVGGGGGVGNCDWTGALTACGEITVGWARLERLQTSWCVDDDPEMACEWRTNCTWSCFRIDLISITLKNGRYLIID